MEPRMTDEYDAVIIGGGHNGLVCAFYLAARRPEGRVLERRDVVGGAAVTEEFHPGFRNSIASYTVSLLQPKVIADMRAARSRLPRDRAADLELPPAGGRRLSQARRRAGAHPGRIRAVLRPAMRQTCPSLLRGAGDAWPKCCATSRSRRRPTLGGGVIAR